MARWHVHRAGGSGRGHVRVLGRSHDHSVGAHKALLAADGAHTAFAAVRFQRSYPLYVAVSNDWDTADHGDDKLERQDRLHARHPRLVITHFVGPYTFTDTSVAPSRVQYLVDWLAHYRDTAGDEIGLHLHPYCNFVTAAGVTCRSHTEAELDKMFAKASALFVAHGLARPTSFRAGGWTAQCTCSRHSAPRGAAPPGARGPR